MKKELELLKDEVYKIKLKPIDFKHDHVTTREIEIIMHSPHGCICNVDTSELAKDTRKLVLSFFSTLATVGGVEMSWVNSIFYYCKPMEKSDTLLVSAVSKVIHTKGNSHVEDRSIRDKAKNLCIQLIAARMITDVLKSDISMPNEEWPMRISTDLKLFLYHKENRTYQFTISAMVDYGNLAITDLVDLMDQIRSLIATPKPSDMIFIHESGKIIGIGSNKAILFRSSKLLEIIKTLFSTFEKMLLQGDNHEDGMLETSKKEEVPKQIRPTSVISDHPLDATFCISPGGFGFGNCIYTPFPKTGLSKVILNKIHRLRDIFGRREVVTVA